MESSELPPRSRWRSKFDGLMLGLIGVGICMLLALAFVIYVSQLRV